jgi:hypothetical protein
MTIVEWILDKLPVLIFVAVFVAQIVRGLFKAREAQAEPPPRHDEIDEARRAEEIRRRIAERRAGRTAPAPAAPAAEPPPVIVRRDPTAIPLPEPFGGPLKRMLEDLEKQVRPEPEPVPAPPVMQQRANAELERQQKLAEELRVLEESRMLAKRRAAQLATANTAASNSSAGQTTAARGRLLDDLRDPESLRRAFVLREVLGPPLALR